MVKTRAEKGGNKDSEIEPKHRASGNQSGRKARNKVSAVKPPKSPELKSPTNGPSGAGTGDDSSLFSGGSVGSGSSTASRPGIPLHIQKQLASDIEAAGGIAAFKAIPEGSEQAVSKLCGTRPEVYGPRGGPLREKIRKKVWHWRQLDKKGEYVEKVLNQLGVKSAANLKKAARSGSLTSSSSSGKKRPATKQGAQGKKLNTGQHLSSSSSSHSSSSSRSKGSGQASVSSNEGPPAEIGFAKTKAVGKTSSSGPKPSRSSRKETATDSSPSRTDRDLHASNQPREAIMPTIGRSSPPKPSGCEVVHVNVDSPEANREFLIYPVQNVQGAKSPQEFYVGYFILIPADKRWYHESREVEHYRARVFSSNQVLVTMPAFDYTMLYNQDELKAPKTQIPEYAINAIDNACHEYDKNKTNRQYKHFLLQFPSDHMLSSSVISDKATEDEYLPLQFHPVETPDKKERSEDETGKKRKKGKTTKRLYISFTVANVAVTAQKRGKVEHKPKESEGARLLDELESDDDEEEEADYSMARASASRPGSALLQSGSYAQPPPTRLSSTGIVPRKAAPGGQRLSSLQRAAAASAHQFGSQLDTLVTDGQEIVSEGHNLLDSIMNDETAHLKRTSPVGGRPDESDFDDYDRKRSPVGDRADTDFDFDGNDKDL